MKIQDQKNLWWVFFAASLLTSAPVTAYMPLNTDDAGTTTKGTYQIEQFFYSLIQVGQSADNADVATSGEDYQGSGNAQAFPFTFSRGLTDNIDLQFALVDRRPGVCRIYLSIDEFGSERCPYKGKISFLQ
jgi:hypothetical protein